MFLQIEVIKFIYHSYYSPSVRRLLLKSSSLFTAPTICLLFYILFNSCLFIVKSYYFVYYSTVVLFVLKSPILYIIQQLSICPNILLLVYYFVYYSAVAYLSYSLLLCKLLNSRLFFLTYCYYYFVYTCLFVLKSTILYIIHQLSICPKFYYFVWNLI